MASSASSRNQDGVDWRLKLGLYVVSGATGGAAMGALLGAIGTALGGGVRAGLGSMLALAAVVIAAIDLTGRRVPLLQRNRETPQRWLHLGPLRWAMLNGAALGSGFSTRLGMWLWYAIPVAALLSARPAFGALIYGIYGGVRTGGVVLLFALTRARGGDLAATTDTLRGWHPRARRAASVGLLSVGLVAAIEVGL